MANNSLFSAELAAEQLGVSVPTLYGWLNQSDVGEFIIRGIPTTIEYYQGGRRGQGRIKMHAQEVERLLSMMRVVPKMPSRRRNTPKKTTLRYITGKLGRPND